MSKPRIGIVLSTTREGRFGDKVGAWLAEIAATRTDAEFELVDLRDFPLPFFDEPASPAYGESQRPEVQKWRAKVAELDGFVFVTAEYNRSVPAVLKNAIDYVYAEWNKKAAAYVGYGPLGAARAIEHLRTISVEMQLAPTRTGVHITWDPYIAVAQGEKTLADFEHLNQGAAATLDELVWWARALKTARVA